MSAPQARGLASAQQQTVVGLRRGIAWQRSSTWYWQDRAGVARTRSVHVERRTTSLAFLGWVDRLWLGRRKAAHRRYLAGRRRVAVVGRVAHMALWLCIHRGEGAWNANTGNGYYGGLQMTAGWGGLARPDLVSPYVQMSTAEREYRASGYSTTWLKGQWPNTSPPCLRYA